MNTESHIMIEALGWSLLHFLWQGTAIALALGLVLHLMRRRSAQSRYLLAGFAFVAMLSAFVLTLTYHWQTGAPPESDAATTKNELSHPARDGLDAASVPASAKALAEGIAGLPGDATPPVESGTVAAKDTGKLSKLDSSPSNSTTPPPAAGPGEMPFIEGVRPALPWVVGIWMGGVFILTLRLLSAWLSLRRLRIAGESPADSAWKKRFAALCERMGVSRPVTLLSSSAVAVPIVMGWLKPVILVPAGLFAGLSTSQLEAILTHELAHVRRHDYIVNLLQNLVETFLFFHPAVWWVSAQLRKEREHCCDDAASTQCGDAVDYARALTALEEMCGAAGTPLVSLAASDGSLIGRIRRLIGAPPRDPAPAISWPAGLAVGFLIATLAVGMNFVHGNPQEPEKESEPEKEPGKKEQAPASIDIYSTAPATYKLTPSVDLVLNRKKDGVNLPEETATLQWRDDKGQVQSKELLRSSEESVTVYKRPNSVYRELGPLDRLAPMRVVGNVLWMEIPPAFGFGILGLRRIDFSDPENLKEQRWTTGEMHLASGIPLPVGVPRARGIDESVYGWLMRARPGVEQKFVISMAPEKEGGQAPVVLEQKHFRSVSRQSEGTAVPPAKNTFDIRLALTDEGRDALVASLVKNPGKQLRAVLNGEAIRRPLKIERNDVVFIRGPFDADSSRRITSYIERILRGDGAPNPERDLTNPLTEIIKAGTYKIDEKTSVSVTSTVEDSGITRNEIHVTHEDGKGQKRTNSAALPYGEGTWAILASKPTKSKNWNLPLAIASAESVRIYQSLNAAELTRPYMHRSGYIDRGSFPAARIAAGGPIIHAPVWSDWMQRVQPELKKETQSPRTPAFELRLIARKDEPTELLRRSAQALSSRAIRNFERLGPRLLSGKDITPTGSGMISGGLAFFDFLVKKESVAEFEKLCAQFSGRKAALVQNGEVWAYVGLRRGLRKFSSMNGFGGLEAEVKKAAPPKRAKPADGANKPDPFAVPDDPADAKAAEAEGIRIDVLGAAGRKPIQEFRVIAGVRSSVSRAFENANGVEVANWQSHTLHQGRNGGLIWPVKKAYKEMALRVEADGYVPQTMKWIKKVDGAQKLTFLLQEDPGVSGRVMTPGNGRPAHDATVVLAMIRRNARITGTVFPELNLGDPKRKLTARDIWDQPLVVKPDNKGRFTLPTETDPTAVVLILHGDGVLEIPYKEWKKSPNVTLLPWGRIHGRVRWGKSWGEEETIDLSANRGDKYGYPGIISQSDDTVSDKEGRFVFQRVLPGRAQLSCPIEVENEKGEKSSCYVQGRISHAEVVAPHTAVMLGGHGRKVTGKLSGREDWEGVTFHFHPNAPRVGFGSDDSMWQAWHALKKSPSGDNYFREGLKVAADGSFEIPGVLPGYYQIFFRKEGAKGYMASSQFRIKAEDRDKRPEPELLPDIRARPAQTR